MDHREPTPESEVRFDVESGAGEDEALILVSNGAVPADVDTAVHLDAKERAITDLPEECVVVEDRSGGGRAAERPPDEVVALGVLGGQIEPHPSKHCVVLRCESVEAVEKLLEIGEEGLEAFALPKSQPLVELLVEQRLLRVDVHGTRFVTQKRREFAILFEALNRPCCRAERHLEVPRCQLAACCLCHHAGLFQRHVLCELHPMHRAFVLKVFFRVDVDKANGCHDCHAASASPTDSLSRGDPNVQADSSKVD